MRSVARFVSISPSSFISVEPMYLATMSDRELSGYVPQERSDDYEQFMKTNQFGQGSDVVCRYQTLLVGAIDIIFLQGVQEAYSVSLQRAMSRS